MVLEVSGVVGRVVLHAQIGEVPARSPGLEIGGVVPRRKPKLTSGRLWASGTFSPIQLIKKTVCAVKIQQAKESLRDYEGVSAFSLTRDQDQHAAEDCQFKLDMSFY